MFEVGLYRNIAVLWNNEFNVMSENSYESNHSVQKF